MKLNRTQVIVLAALLAGAVLAFVVEMAASRAPQPVQPDGGLSLRGKFQGPEAAADAAKLAGICHGIAEAMLADQARPVPRIQTGVHIEDVRIAAAEGRFMPRSFTRDQPHAAAAAGRYLDTVVGTSGGPLDATTRMKWIEAFRALAAAAEEAIQ